MESVKKKGLKLFNPYVFYLEYKRRNLLKVYRRKEISLGLGVSISNSDIGMYVSLGNKVTLNNSFIGGHSYVNSNSIINRTRIGKFCSIGPDVKIGMGIHPTDLISTHPAFYSNNKVFKTYADKMYVTEYGEINIGNDVWIGSNVIIMDNIKIEDGAVIASGAIVTKNVKSYSVVGGVPAKHIKMRFDNEEIEKLLKIKWWDRDEKWLKNNYKIFLEKNVFFDYFE